MSTAKEPTKPPADRPKPTPPPPPPPLACAHDYVHLETRRHNEYTGFVTHWIREDVFFCRHCLDERVRRQEGYSRETPDWYLKATP